MRQNRHERHSFAADCKTTVERLQMEFHHLPSFPNASLRTGDFNIGWLCALAIEEDAIIRLLDKQLTSPVDLKASKTGSLYNYGMIGRHRVVIRTLPTGSPDNAAASAAIHLMSEQFINIDNFLFSGIAGGLPGDIHPLDANQNLHIGDVVIATPGNGHSGIINNTVHKVTTKGKQMARITDKSSTIWRNASDYFVNRYNRDQSILKPFLDVFPKPSGQDQLFRPSSKHYSERHRECTQCLPEDVFIRPEREDNAFPRIFKAALVIGDLIRDGEERDKISKVFPDARAVDMESSGFVEGFGSLIVRGISDYADAHKSDKWQGWAAGRAAAVAKAILLDANINLSLPLLRENPEGNLDQFGTYRLQFNYALCPDFHGYDDVISFLEQKLITHRDPYRQKQVVVLYGHTGTGKSAACDEFYIRNRDRFWGAWRINASSGASLADAMSEILSDLDATTSQITNIPIEQVTKQAMTMLKRIRKPWLLIIENADQDLPYMSNIPASDWGSAIITSRRANCCALDRPISYPMPVIDENEARKLLWFSLNIHSAPCDQAADATMMALVRRLHCLPMAIRAASSTIINDPRFHVLTVEQSLRDYLDRIDEKPGPDHALQSLWASPEDPNMPSMAMTTFSTLLDALAHQHGPSELVDDAFELLKLFAFWSSAGVLGSLLSAILQRQFEVEAFVIDKESLTYIPNILTLDATRENTNMLRIERAVGLLRQFSLLTQIGHDQNFEVARCRMHPMFQECFRLSRFIQPCQGIEDALGAVVTLSYCASAKGFQKSIRHLRRLLLPHVETSERVMEQSHSTEWHCTLFSNLSESLASTTLLNISMIHFDSGNLLRAEKQQRYVFEKLQRYSSDSHELLWRAQAYLATSLHDLRSRSEAKKLRLELVQKLQTKEASNARSRHFSFYVDCLSDLADSYDISIQDRYKAVPLREEVLAAMSEIDSASVQVRYAEQRLARTYHLSGEQQRALELRQAMMTTLKATPESQELRLEAMSELAESLHAKGFWQEALNMRLNHERATSELFGQGHPDALAAKLNLAVSLSAMDRREEALALRTEVYNSRLALFGHDADPTSSTLPHPMMLHALGMLARSEADCGDTDKAIDILQSAMDTWHKFNSQVRLSYMDDYLNQQRLLASLLEKRIAHLRYTESQSLNECYRAAITQREHIAQTLADVLGSTSSAALLAAMQLVRTYLARGDLLGAHSHAARIMHELEQTAHATNVVTTDADYLGILRLRADVYESLYFYYRPQFHADSRTANIPSEDIAATLTGSSDSSSEPAVSENIRGEGSQTTRLQSVINHDHEFCSPYDFVEWLKKALSIRCTVSHIQESKNMRIENFDQRGLEDMAKLAGVLSETNHAEALMLYQKVIIVMEQAERLGDRHPRISELRQRIAPSLGILQWLGALAVEFEEESQPENHYSTANSSWRTSDSLD